MSTQKIRQNLPSYQITILEMILVVANAACLCRIAAFMWSFYYGGH